MVSAGFSFIYCLTSSALDYSAIAPSLFLGKILRRRKNEEEKIETSPQKILWLEKCLESKKYATWLEPSQPISELAINQIPSALLNMPAVGLELDLG